MATPAEVAETRRATIESEYNGNRDTLEKQYISDRNDLEDQFHADVLANEKAKQAAMVAEGLNPDGGDPQGRQQGSAL